MIPSFRSSPRSVVNLGAYETTAPLVSLQHVSVSCYVFIIEHSDGIPGPHGVQGAEATWRQTPRLSRKRRHIVPDPELDRWLTEVLGPEAENELLGQGVYPQVTMLIK